ncbi:Neurotransmitter-gated ion-channel ligand-binding domain-containing protein [Caenorhabditis elegans]|uniref:Neurotransmitter-gated ion-channel ligand-binding domain-containing protein n=1 Tax=Caenorhabditis elegans TaxID=6239 RepID=U4PBJ1_CAEEL|nr:Neurotransmitter-gated ion-channel ligand-binding domain-containing protein [Caenorhabditis elegans]CDH93233.1 Neurotransmitter-gated ion-channel ligand-binding domain-containing protein [Caenorhabditis elegans]|eukprot:NP_001294461.1 Ligand-Gated ion Channel [Caenorhabditis elegans]
MVASKKIGMMAFTKLACLLLLFYQFSLVSSISQNELNELSRKFKYYHSAVRPAAPDNFVSDRNGTFFNIPVEIHLLATRIVNRNLYLEVIIVMTWIDERLRLRELQDRFSMPSEYPPWHPSLVFAPPVTSKYTTLAPTSGTVNSYNTIKTTVECQTNAWKYPFESFTCTLSVGPEGDETLTVAQFHDLRSHTQKLLTNVFLGDYPTCSLEFIFKSEWPRALLSSFLPSILIVSSVFFAQWKRRKIQILVSLAAMVGILIMLCSQRPYTSTTLMDLWLCANFIHSVFLVFVDLTLPARRVRYTLMVHVDEEKKQANPVKIMTSEHSGPLRYVNHVIDYLMKKEHKPRTTIVTACPGPTPIQRQITTAMLGNRKRAALFCIFLSYLTFLLIYAIIVIVID